MDRLAGEATRQHGLGARVVPEKGVQFRVWAPHAALVEVQVEALGGAIHHPLTPEADGYHAGHVATVQAGDRYRYRLDGGAAYPDPCSRFQPAGPHGPSQVVDPRAYVWRDDAWPGLGPDGLVIYELHVGTFTPEGTFDAIVPQLSELVRLGVTAIELMPIAEFPGRRNWGYDGVNLYAPSSRYGGPEALQRLVDAAHGHGLGVLLDVVYNHLGPDGNYLRAFADAYFTDRHTTPWGDAVNYDGPRSEHVRRFILDNARAWLEEYHLDGLRLDATHAIVDNGPRHLLSEMADLVHGPRGVPALDGRRAVVIAEDNRNDTTLIRPAAGGGYGLDGVWTDDFHHALRTYLTGARESYYGDYSGRLEDVARAIESGFLYQGQHSATTGAPRGTSVADEPARAFVFCTENHDQVGNRAFGERLAHLIDRERYLVASAVLLLAPETPLIFQGQEFAATSPFLYFTDHTPQLGRLVTAGRREEFKAFSAFRDPSVRAQIPDPQADATFLRSRLNFSDRERHADVYRVYQELLTLRRTDPVLRHQDRQATRAWTVGEHLLVLLRWHASEHRLLLANFGDAPARVSVQELQLPSTQDWRSVWSTPASAPLVDALELDAQHVQPRAAHLLALHT